LIEVSMAKPRLLINRARVIVVEWPAEIDTGELGEHFREVVDLFDEVKKSVVFVVDLTCSKGLKASLRLVAARGVGGLVARAATRVGGIACVTTSVQLRGELTAIHWLAPVPFETTIVGTRAEGLRWAELQLARADAKANEAARREPIGKGGDRRHEPIGKGGDRRHEHYR
jgi:hypothetical protein